MDDVDIHAPDFVANPFAAFQRLRENCPAARSHKHGGFWMLTRYDDVRATSINWRDFTAIRMPSRAGRSGETGAAWPRCRCASRNR